METSVAFDAECFAPFLPEESQVNPAVYGAELAFWLARELAEAGVVTSYPNYEDWGWFIEYITDEGDEYWLCCGNREGSKDKWLCYLDPKAKSLFGRNRADVENALPLLRGLKSVLGKSQAVTNVVWSEVE
ncbi:MAG: hypothetical protein ACN4GR_01445 [Arenicellales bacterium]